MKHLRKLSFVALGLLLASCAGRQAPTLDDRNDTFSWVLGENVALSILQGNTIDVDHDVFVQAIRHTLDGKEQPLPDSVYQQALQYIMAQAQLQQMRSTGTAKEQAQQAQQHYFEQLEKTNPNVVKHPDGFYYEVLKAGHGPKAVYGHSVRFDYRSFKMLTGEPFDQTYGVRDPIDHVVGSPMFKGLLEGLQLMNAGSIYRFYFPYQIGPYPNVGGMQFTPMIYEVELHELLD